MNKVTCNFAYDEENGFRQLSDAEMEELTSKENYIVGKEFVIDLKRVGDGKVQPECVTPAE